MGVVVKSQVTFVGCIPAMNLALFPDGEAGAAALDAVTESSELIGIAIVPG